MSEIDDLRKQLDDMQQEMRRPGILSRTLASVRSRLPSPPTVSLAAAADASWKTAMTVAVAGLLGLFTLPISGCPSITPKPLPGAPKVLIAFDSSSRFEQDFLSATDSDDVRAHILANVAKGPEGAPEFRVLDINTDMTAEHPAWQDAMKQAKGKTLPVALINGTLAHYDGEVPKGNAAMVALLKKCFGDNRLPKMARPPPEAYGLTDDDLKPKDKQTGLIPRDFKAQPFGTLAWAPPYDLKDMTDEEIEAAIVRKDADHSWLDDLRNHGGKDGIRFPSLDQDGKGFCWTHSSTVTVEYVRAKNGQPFASLSAFSIACMINGFRDGGGWGSASMEFVATKGVPSDTFWPQQSMARKNDNAQTWADAAKHKVTRWMELEPRNARQLATCVCNNIPVVTDLNWWGHSIATVRIVSWGKNGSNLKTRIQNSWSDKWGTNGIGELVGSKAIPDAAVAPRVVVASYAQKAPATVYTKAP